MAFLSMIHAYVHVLAYGRELNPDELPHTNANVLSNVNTRMLCITREIIVKM